jgi:hypothetical protein
MALLLLMLPLALVVVVTPLAATSPVVVASVLSGVNHV